MGKVGEAEDHTAEKPVSAVSSRPQKSCCINRRVARVKGFSLVSKEKMTN